MALLLILYVTTRCYIGFISTTKHIRVLKYRYPLEGAAFVGLSILVVSVWGMSGIIASALVSDFLFSGAYGFWRVTQYFGIRHVTTLLAWLRGPLLCLLSLATVAAGTACVDRGWSTDVRLGVNAAVGSLAGFGLFWRFGLSPELRVETASLPCRFRERLRLCPRPPAGAPDPQE
jgi:hypothetical protein